MEAGSPFREPFVKFLERFPLQTIEFLLSDLNVQDEQRNRFLEVFMIKNDCFRFLLIVI